MWSFLCFQKGATHRHSTSRPRWDYVYQWQPLLMAIINVSLQLNGHTGICLSSILHHSVLIKLQMFIDTRYQDTKQICVSISYVTDKVHRTYLLCVLVSNCYHKTNYRNILDILFVPWPSLYTLWLINDILHVLSICTCWYTLNIIIQC